MKEKSNMKHKKLIAGAVAMFLIIAAMIAASFLRIPKTGGEDPRDEMGEARPSYALDMLGTEFSGESRIDSFVGTNEAMGKADPVTYMIDHSMFLIDQEAIDEKVAERLSGAEMSANAEGISIAEYLLERGYDSVEAYESAVESEIVQFVKGRLCVYAAAEELGIEITEEEYQTLLPEYADKFGFEDAETFSYVCRPGSIASEMLYDKTVEALK